MYHAESSKSHSLGEHIDMSGIQYYNPPCRSYSQNCVSLEELIRQEAEDDYKKRRNLSMSYAQGIIKLNRVVLAADSRSSIIGKNGQVQEWSDGFQKVVYLPKLKVGFAAAGDNIIQDMPICDWLLSKDRDGRINGDHPETIGEIFRPIAAEVSENIREGGIVNLACGGFEDGRAKLLYTDIFCQKEVQIQESAFIWYTKGHVLPLLTNADGNLGIQLNDVRSMLDFSDFIVSTEIQYARFREKIPSVGGSVQMLLLENGCGKWIRSLY